MSISYPAEGPKALRGSLKEGEADAFIEDKPEIGDSRRRINTTRALRSFSFQAKVTEAERLDFRKFYHTDLLKGTLAFDWTHPISGEVVSVRFKGYPAFQDKPVDSWKMTISLVEI